ncbi:MAG TPA: DUF1003 domain-containing protein [Candidatus Saccharimonadales bacterium]|jgi:uncharacterized membrane protein
MRNPTNWHKQHKQSLTTGERAADILRNTMGSWSFVFGFLTFLGLWALLNTNPNVAHWDKFPFILLNLFLSMLAALQGAILLIAAKRMDAISAAQARRDLATDIAAKEEIEVLMQQNERQLKDIAELRVLLEKRLK